jgi:hypothetical protein
MTVTELAPPVSDEDRSRVVDRIRTVAAEALDLEEFESLVEAAWAAPSWSALEAVAARAPLPPPPDPSCETVAAVGWPTRRGQGWQPPDVVLATAVLGNVVVDLTEASWDGRPVRIEASVVMGGAEVVVPHDVHVELRRWAWWGSARVVGRSGGTPPADAPRVSVRAQTLAGSVVVRRHAFRGIRGRSS